MKNWKDCNFKTKYDYCQLKKGSFTATKFCSRENCIFMREK